jgi:hypothetical protein
MRRNEMTRKLALHLLAGLSILSAGCGGPDLVTLKDREISELRFESERRRQSIVEYLDELEVQRQSHGALEAECKDLVTQAESLAVALRGANELARQNALQRDETKKRLTDLEESQGRLKESLDKVKSVASASAGELSDLRLKRQELEAQLQVVSRNEAALREEKKTLVAELEDARAELVRTKAVARSLQEGSTAAQNIALTAQEERIRLLERELSGLRGENAALHHRVSALSAATGEEEPAVAVSQPAAAARPEGAYYRNHPAGLIVELQGILRDRYDRAKQGQMVWDAFDFCVAGVAVVAALTVLLLGVRLVRAFRPRAAHPVASRVEAHASPEPAAPRAEAPAASPRPSDSFRTRKPAAARRSTFSAVISNKPGESAAAGRGDAVAVETAGDEGEGPSGSSTEAFEKAFEPAPVAPAGGEVERQARAPRVDPRKVIGARSWSSEAPAAAAADDGVEELANTQIIPKLTAEEVAAPAPVRSPSTAIRRPSVTVPKTAKYPKPEAKPRGGDDKDLLNELKAVINKKFDELIQ